MKNKLVLLSIMLFYANVMFLSSCNKDTVDDTTTSVTDNLPDISGYPIVGTNQSTAFDSMAIISIPVIGQEYYGQNANYPGTTPSYTDNGDGTVTDNVTGLMWQNTLDHNGDGLIDVNDKLTYDEILALPNTCNTGGHTDWRVPTIKEQYSLMMFSGRDISGYDGSDTAGLTPFINTKFFGYNYGDTDAGERMIDVQCASTNVFVGSSTVKMIFGVNFADGRIKGYGNTMMGESKKFNYLLCRGNSSYGENSFTDNSDGTITDAATGLMWMQDDSKASMNWKFALNFAENFTYAGYSDWRLPDAKELQSIVDYTRSPQTTASAAIDPLFNCTQITNEAGEDDFPFYWSSTTHANMNAGAEGGWGAYVSFGRAMGNEPSMPGGPPPTSANWTDVHGAGAQRSDPKSGDPSEYSEGHGPQGDAVRIFNYVRLVRDVK